MLSGIGPKAHLAELRYNDCGRFTWVDKIAQDHLDAIVKFVARSLISLRELWAIPRYIKAAFDLPFQRKGI